MQKDNDLTELQMLHQKQLKEKRDALKERKARTHRLIVRGAIAETVVEGAADMTDEQFQQSLYQAFGKSDASGHPQDSRGSARREDPPEGACGSNPR